jgi:hypothetical protein
VLQRERVELAYVGRKAADVGVQPPHEVGRLDVGGHRDARCRVDDRSGLRIVDVQEQREPCRVERERGTGLQQRRQAYRSRWSR